MNKLLSQTLFVVVIMMCGFSAIAAPDGRALYGENCAACHGLNGEGGVGVPLKLPSFINSISDEYIFKTIRYGRPGRIMPAFGELSDAQVNAIAKFVRAWGNGKHKNENTKLIAGDISNGKLLFQKRCVQCHGENGKGGSGTGVTFSRKRDFPIIAPSLSNTGFLKSATDMMIRNTIKNGRKGTPMTPQLVAGLSGDDVDDLVAYIRSFKDLEKIKLDIADTSPVIIMDSPYGMDETIENLKQSIAGQNFTLIRTEPLDKALVKPGDENKKQMVLHFCNFGFLFKALSIDPRVGMFLPCRITVVEHKGKVKVMAINPLNLSKLFNNEELDIVCKEMYETYTTLLEDAVL